MSIREIRDGEVFGPDCTVCGAATTKGECLSCGTKAPVVIEAVFDGCCEPRNPGGHAAFGSLVCVNGEIVYRNSGYCGFGLGMSNNVAEFSGALDALTEAVKHNGRINLRGDSRLVIMLVGPDSSSRFGNERWESHGGAYVPYYHRCLELVNAHRHRMTFTWVPREKNADCDELSKQILIDRGIKFKIQPLEGGNASPIRSHLIR
jgi:ribonuclease HI